MTVDTPVLVALITAIALLLGAVIAAVTAHWRLKRELRHDRSVKDLEEVRALLDEAMGEAVISYRVLADATGAWAFAEDDRLRSLEELGRRRDALNAYTWRLFMRFGAAHSVPTAYNLLFDVVVAVIKRITEPPTGTQDERAASMHAHTRTYREVEQAFAERAYEVIGTRLDE